MPEGTPKRPRVKQVTLADKLAAKKLADRYVRRDGARASFIDAQLAGRMQDLNDDDRKHLRWCVGAIYKAIGQAPSPALDALTFIDTFLDANFRIYPNREV